MMGETIRQLLDESQMLRDNPRSNLVSGLTVREKEVIELICVGMKTREIADALFITENTVRHHLTSVFNKLELKGRLELVIYSFKNGLASMPKSNVSTNGARRPIQDLSQTLSV
jgi:DNA-binding NarL/FixJ family response regulator